MVFQSYIVILQLMGLWLQKPCEAPPQPLLNISFCSQRTAIGWVFSAGWTVEKNEQKKTAV